MHQFFPKVCVFFALIAFVASEARGLDARKAMRLYAHEVWRTEEGLPQNTVKQVLQTRDGYLWLATEAGLARFDGVRFEIYDKDNTPVFAGNSIRRLYEDRAGTLWCSMPRQLLRRENDQFVDVSGAEGLPAGAEFSSFYEDHENNLWLASSQGLVRFRDGTFTTFTAHDGLAGDVVEAVVADAQNTLWIGTTRGLSRWQDDRFTSYTTADGLSHNAVRALYVDRDNALWIGTRDGLTLFKGGKFSAYTTRDGLSAQSIETLHGDGRQLFIGTLGGLTVWRDGNFTAFTVRDGLPSNRIGEILADRAGNVWVGTEGGLARWRAGRFENLTVNQGLSSNVVLSVLEDREGNLWIGTESGGLNVLKDKKFAAYTIREGLPADLVRAIHEDARGQLWFGTHEGGLGLLKDNEFTAFTTREGLSSNTVLAIESDRQGNLWIGTPDGLNLYRDNRFTLYTSANGLANDFVRSIYEDRAGRLWIGTRGGLSVLENGEFTSYTTLDGLPNDFIGAVLEDRHGDLWIGTLNGLARLRNGEFTSYGTRDGLAGEIVTALHEGPDGELWIGTNGGGLSVWRDNKFSSFNTKHGLFSDVVYCILADDAGHLWLSSNKGISRVSRQELLAVADGRSARIGGEAYGTADGMRTRECSGGGHPAGWKTANGKLWFSTIKGAVVIDPADIKLNEQAPPVVIESVMVDGEAFDPRRQATLQAGKSSFHFQFAGLSFVAPDKVTYKYRLEGFDREWVEAGARREAFYTNIPPGNYVFRVAAANNDGVWNETGAAFSFRLNPHFYQTYWFYALCFIAAGVLAWQVYLLRVRRMRTRFSAVLQERNRIAREIHDTLAQGFAGISVQLELVARMIATAKPDQARTHLDQARILVRTSLAEARRSVWDLRSQALESGGLPEALAETAKQLTAGTPVQTGVQVSGTARQLAPAVENNLLRIGQEAITNAIKHAEARRILVDLSFHQQSVRLEVRDDGRGFAPDSYQPSPVEGHFGLRGMRERAEQIGGVLTINSAAGAGTEIVVDVKLNGHNE